MADQDDELYDEFGNYIGPELDSSDSDSDSDSEGSGRGGDNDDGGSAAMGDAEPDGGGSDVSDMEVEEGGEGAVVVRDPTAPPAPGAPLSAIVLHEDKEHYRSAADTYGPGVAAAVLDEDALGLDVPIVEPVRTGRTGMAADIRGGDGEFGTAPLAGGGDGDDGPEELVSEEYLASLLGEGSALARRGVALVGGPHCGKTTLVDLLIEQTRASGPDALGPLASHEGQALRGTRRSTSGPRIADDLRAEQERGLSLRSTPLTLCLPDTRGKTYAVTLMDCPGHPNFHDEAAASLRAADGAVLAVDAVDGVTMPTEMAAAQAVAEGLPLTLVLTKIDRLIVELKLPPADAYYKLRRSIDEVNAMVAQKSGGRYPPLDPASGNVAFASGTHGWCFTLESLATQYLDHVDDDDDEGGDADRGYRLVNGIKVASGFSGGLGRNLDPEGFARRLWGEAFLDPATRTFKRKASECDAGGGGPVRRTFVEFVLLPLYRMYAACLGEEERDIERTLRGVGVLLSRDQLRASARPLLRAACRRFFGPSTGLVDMVVRHW